MLAYCAVGLGTKATSRPASLARGSRSSTLAVAAHFVIRRVAPYADPVLLPLVLCLNGLGLAMIYRLDLGRTQLDPYRAAVRQLPTRSGRSSALPRSPASSFAVRDHRRLQSLTYTFGFAALALLILPLLPVIGRTINGARIWINLGPFSFQPGEAAKICLAIFFAGYLVVKRDALALAGRRFAGIDLPRGRDLGPILAGWLVSVGILVLQRDLGSSLLFFGLFVVMLYVATERPGWLVVGGLLFAVGAWFGYLAFGHVGSASTPGSNRSPIPTATARSSTACSAWRTAASSAAGWARAARSSRRSRSPTSSPPRWARSSGSPA